jgi:hypothetical protein
LAEGLPRSRDEFRLVFLRFSRGKLAPYNLIFHNETDWARSCRSFRSDDQLLGLLNVSLILRRVNSMDKPNGRLVLVSYTHYCASTSSLSTRWSSWTLLDPFGLGDLILGRASRLYAFSGYHNRTSLPSRALGRTTGTQEVRPSRSSRTKDSPPQISYAHSR